MSLLTQLCALSDNVLLKSVVFGAVSDSDQKSERAYGTHPLWTERETLGEFHHLFQKLRKQ